MSVQYYMLADGRIWDIQKARWIDPIMVASEVEQDSMPLEITELVSAEGISNVKYLAKTLAFYGYPLGELAMYSVQGIKEELTRLDEIYLTPRVLAGLATGDEYSKAQWQEHEKKAKPLRARLAELEDEN